MHRRVGLFPPKCIFSWGEVHPVSKIISTTDTMDRPPDVPPRPPEAIIDLSQLSSSKSASKIYNFFKPLSTIAVARVADQTGFNWQLTT
jgi:hypothetical protein